MSKPFKWVVEVEVDPMWVEDGFQFTPANVEDRIAHLLPYARQGSEVTARVLKAPDKKWVLKLQGYDPKKRMCVPCEGKGQYRSLAGGWILCGVCEGTGEK